MFRLNLKIALRNLWKNKGITAINVGGLAIGMACCLMLLLYVNYELSYDKQFKNINKIYISALNLKINGKLATTMAIPNKLSKAALEELPGFKRSARVSFDRTLKLYSHGKDNFKLAPQYVDPDFIKIFDYHFIYGDANTALNEPGAIIINETTAKKLFANANPIGQRITYDGNKELKVTAVIEDSPKNQSMQFDVLHPWSFFDQLNPEDKNNGWGAITCMTYFELKDNVSMEETNDLLQKFIVNKEPALKTMTYEPFLLPYTKMHLYNNFQNGKLAGGRIDQVRLFIFLAFCVLLIACINYMNLSTARSEKRAREVGVRKALGSSRNTIIGQFMIESLMLSFIAMLIAFAMIEIVLPYFNNLLDIKILINYTGSIWLILFGLVLITGFLAGSYPAFYLSSFIPIKVLKGFKGASGSLSIRKILVVFQFSLSICMIISAVVIYNQIQYMRNKPLGFNVAALAQIDLEGELTQPGRLEVFKNELKRAGAIESATEYAGAFTTDGGNITRDVSWPNKPKNDVSIVSYRSTGFNFANTAGVKIVEGRDFSPKFSADTSTSLLLNQEAVKLMQLKNPVGTIIHWSDNPPLKIVGVVQDFFNESLGAKVSPTIYYYNVKQSHSLLLKLNSQQSLSTSIETIKQISKQLNPAYPAEIKLVSEGMAEKIKSEKLLSVLSNIFGGFAIFISCLGLLGLALYMAEQRSKEISIRKVLGANLSDILILLNKDFMKLVIISNVIAIPVAYILVNNWLQKYDYKIGISFWPFILALCTSIIIAVLTVSLQTFKVAKANPVDALKYE